MIGSGKPSVLMHGTVLQCWSRPIGLLKNRGGIKGILMTNLDRFIKTIHWEIPDLLMTFDFVDNREMFETYEGILRHGSFL